MLFSILGGVLLGRIRRDSSANAPITEETNGASNSEITTQKPPHDNVITHLSLFYCFIDLPLFMRIIRLCTCGGLRL